MSRLPPYSPLACLHLHGNTYHWPSFWCCWFLSIKGRRAASGLLSPPLVPLFGAPKRDPSKNREMGGSLALGLSGWVGLGRVGSGRVGSGPGRVGGFVGSGWVGSGRVGSGRAGSGGWVVLGWVGLGWMGSDGRMHSWQGGEWFLQWWWRNQQSQRREVILTTMMTATTTTKMMTTTTQGQCRPHLWHNNQPAAGCIPGREEG